MPRGELLGRNSMDGSIVGVKVGLRFLSQVLYFDAYGLYYAFLLA